MIARDAPTGAPAHFAVVPEAQRWMAEQKAGTDEGNYTPFTVTTPKRRVEKRW